MRILRPTLLALALAFTVGCTGHVAAQAPVAAVPAAHKHTAHFQRLGMS